MKTTTTLQGTMILLGALLMAACSSTPGPKDIPANSEFTTQILADGTKLFTLKLHPEKGAGPDGSMPKNARGDRSSDRAADRRSGGGDCFPCRPGEGDRANGRSDERAREVDLHAIATAMIAENHYCREGFVILEQYQHNRDRILRGECRDMADAGERARFTN